MNPLRRFLRWRHDDWFAPADPRHLAIARMLIFFYIWPGFDAGPLASGGDADGAAWMPISLFKLLALPAPGHLAGVLDAVLWGSALMAMIGLLFPVSSLVCALTWFYCAGLQQNFGKINHNALIVLVPLLLSFSRAADTWSVDALRAGRWRPGRTALAPRPEYRWPLMAIAALVLSMYGAAGATKMLETGWNWALSDSFSNLLLRQQFVGNPPTNLGPWLARHPTLCQRLALASLCLELAGPLGLLSKRARQLLLPGYAAMQTGIWLMMGIAFRMMIPLFLCLVPWPALLDRGQRWLATLGGGSRLAAPPGS